MWQRKVTLKRIRLDQSGISSFDTHIIWLDRKLNSGVWGQCSVLYLLRDIEIHLSLCIARFFAIRKKQTIKLDKTNRILLSAKVKRVDANKMCVQALTIHWNWTECCSVIGYDVLLASRHSKTGLCTVPYCQNWGNCEFIATNPLQRWRYLTVPRLALGRCQPAYCVCPVS
jgi:hypothetical protein